MLKAEQTPALTRFRDDARGLAAIELALILPMMVLVLVIAVVLADGLAIEGKVARTARTITDLVAQQTSVSAAGLAQMLGAASAVMAPYDSANLSLVVSEIQTDGSGNATVAWSQAAFNGVARPQGQSVPVPSAFAQPNATLIFGEVSYTYKPINLSSIVPTSYPLTAGFYILPRQSTSITLTP